MTPHIQKDIDKLMRKLEYVTDNARKESKAALRKGSVFIVQNVVQRAPQSEKTHYRYKAGGQRTEYTPGNLKRSIKTLVFRNSQAVFVGPAVGKRATKGDGWYAHFVEYGIPSKKYPPNPFFRAGVAAAGDLPIEYAAKILKRKIEQHAKKLSNL